MLLNPVRHDKNMKHLRVLPKMLVIECAYLQHDTLYRGHPLQHQLRRLKVFSCTIHKTTYCTFLITQNSIVLCDKYLQ